MKVSSLRTHLSDLTRLLESSGAAKKVLDDLHAITKGLEVFAEFELRAFADFLSRAHGYHADGKVPVTPPTKTTKEKPKPKDILPKPVALDAADLAKAVRVLFDRAADPSVTAEQIEATLTRLSVLPKAGLVTVAEAVELKGMKNKSMSEIASQIRLQIFDRKGATQRAGMTEFSQNLPNPVPKPTAPVAAPAHS